MDAGASTSGASGLGLGALTLAFGGCTDTGPTRALNEDSWLAAPPVFVVADGMGGHRAGDVASRLVVEQFALLASDPSIDVERVERCVATCQRLIGELADGDDRPPGSTLVALTLVQESGRHYWLVTNVGDSRAYAMTHGELDRLSHDHSVVQELLDAGSITPEQVADHPDRHVITRALGGEVDFRADYSLLPAEPGQQLFIGSDGVVAVLDDSEIGRCLREEADPTRAAELLVSRALAAGGDDNATAVVVRVDGTSAGAAATDTRPSRILASGADR